VGGNGTEEKETDLIYLGVKQRIIRFPTRKFDRWDREFQGQTGY
jgi:hypothetical protein